jgi:hypothetical protein
MSVAKSKMDFDFEEASGAKSTFIESKPEEILAPPPEKNETIKPAKKFSLENGNELLYVQTIGENGEISYQYKFLQEIDGLEMLSWLKSIPVGQHLIKLSCASLKLKDESDLVGELNIQKNRTYLFKMITQWQSGPGVFGLIEKETMATA